MNPVEQFFQPPDQLYLGDAQFSIRGDPLSAKSRLNRCSSSTNSGATPVEAKSWVDYRLGSSRIFVIERIEKFQGYRHYLRLGYDFVIFLIECHPTIITDGTRAAGLRFITRRAARWVPIKLP